MAEGVVEEDVGDMVAWFTAELVAVVVTETAREVNEETAEVAARLARN